MAEKQGSTVRIAVVQAMDGYLTCVGPDDFVETEYPSGAMDAAISYHLEAGHLPAAVYWVEAQLPALPDVPELRGQAVAGTFPKAFLDDMEDDRAGAPA